MASNQLVVLAIVAIILPTVALATEHIVGDAYGWNIDFDYQEWARDKIFRVGDTLVFQYDPNYHNVFKVNETQFWDCIIPPPNEAFHSGNDKIVLATPGNKWYICGTPTHCSYYFQRLAIIVLSQEAPAPAYSMPPSLPPSSSGYNWFAMKQRF